MNTSGGLIPPSDDPFYTLAIELGMIPRKLKTMKTVFHLMYGEFRFDIDQTFESLEEIVPFLEIASKLGMKPQPVYAKDKKENAADVVGKMGTIKHIDEGKTKGDKPCYFLRILLDGMPEDTPKNEMKEIMSFPMTKGRSKMCMWNTGDHVVFIKNDNGFIDIDDATNITEDMTEAEKKS